MRKTEYVVGFLFDSEECREEGYAPRVVLIRKTHPAWQSGRFNGIGGKIRDDEKPSMAMWREFKEEAGLSIIGWEHVVKLTGLDWVVYFYRAFGNTSEVKTCTEEQVIVCHSDALPVAVLPGLNWLIPLCLDTSGVKFPLEIEDTR